MSEPVKIHAAIIAIMRAIGPIAKDSQNTQQNYKFRGVDAVYNACHPHFSEHGVYSASTILEAEHRNETDKNGKPVNRAIIKMRFTFYAEDGSNVSTEVVGEGMDYGGDKASNKAMSVADKYALLQLLKIPTAMEDPDRDPGQRPRGNPNAANAAPRNERVSTPMLTSLVNKWKAANPGRNKSDWAAFVVGVTAREFSIQDPGMWTLKEFRDVEAELNQKGESTDGEF